MRGLSASAPVAGGVRIWLMVIAAGLWAVPPARAQAPPQPLVTQSPVTVGAGLVQFTTGMDYGHGRSFPTSGLTGNFWRAPLLTMQIGLGSRVELQMAGGLHDQLNITSRRPAPLSGAIVGTGNSRTDYDDLTVSTKVQVAGSATDPRRPAFGVLFGTELPNAKHYSGLGQDTTDFTVLGLGAVQVGVVRLIGNLGLGVLGDPLNGHHHEKVMEYGLAATHAMTRALWIVGEVNGRIDLPAGPPPPGTEDAGEGRLGLRYRRWRGWFGVAAIFGLTPRDPGFGVAASYAFALHLFRTS